jgi:hypothetical protein
LPLVYGYGYGEGGFGAYDEATGGQRIRKKSKEYLQLRVGGELIELSVGVYIGLEKVGRFVGVGSEGLVEGGEEG